METNDKVAAMFKELAEVEEKHNVTLIIYPDYAYWLRGDSFGNQGRELYGANGNGSYNDSRLSSIRLAIDIMNDDELRAEYMGEIEE